VKRLMLAKTERGFKRADFTDGNGEGCSIQESSAVESDFLWLGVNETIPKVLVRGEGWKDVPLPEDALTASRMHLTRENAAALWPLLKRFAERGRL
jgi:hypothetical protein